MTLGRRYPALILAATAGLAIALFLLIPTFMQDMERQSIPNDSTAGLRKLRDPKIVIKKKARVLEVYDGVDLIKSYTVVLGFTPVGDKEREGDGKTPEGEFYIFTKNAKSRFHLSVGLSYPSKDDAERGLKSGLITAAEREEIVRAIDAKKMPPQKTALGGEIYIHGGGIERDWTEGCIAMKNAEIEELYNAVPVGAKVAIVP
jgi:murein L,D-transpeptidase YafK